MKLNFGESVYISVNHFLDVMAAAGHSTSWSTGNAARDDEPAQFFLFFTIDTERAKKVQEVLEREGLLCHTDLGAYDFVDGKMVRRC